MEIKGSYDRLVSTAFYQDLDREAYYHVTLTDEDDILGALGRMRTVYPNIMNLDYDNKRTRAVLEMDRLPDPVQETPLDTFMEFYQNVNGTPMSQEQRKVCGDLIEKIWQEGGEKL